MKHEIETAMKTAAVTYATLGLVGVLVLPVTYAVSVVAMAAGAAAVSGAIAYFLTRPLAGH